MALNAWGESRVGRERDENQDSYALLPERGLYVLSDGMGGHAGGALASRSVVEAMQAEDDPRATNPGSPRVWLRRLVLEAHEKTASLAGELGHQGDMGATLVCLHLNAKGYLLAAVGDSRAYLWREGELWQLNEDHTVVQNYVRQGVLEADEVESHPQRHMLTQAMGVNRVEPDIFEGRLQTGDCFLLTSDGVHDVLSRDQLVRALESADEPRDAVKAMLDMVAEEQGNDDATAVVVFS